MALLDLMEEEADEVTFENINTWCDAIGEINVLSKVKLNTVQNGEGRLFKHHFRGLLTNVGVPLVIQYPLMRINNMKSDNGKQWVPYEAIPYMDIFMPELGRLETLFDKLNMTVGVQSNTVL